MKKKTWKNWLVNSLLFLLLLIGLALVFNNQIKNFLIKKNSETYTISEVSKKEIATNLEQDASFDFEAVVPVSVEDVLKAQFKNKVLPVIGGVAVPSVQINLPIFKGLGNTELLYGAGTFHPNQLMGEGNYALASHRIEQSDILFSHLDQVKLGDTVYLTDLTNIYTYQVTVSERIDPSRVEVVEDVPGKKLVTLLSCGEASAVTRWLVQGELTAVTTITEADEQALTAFNLDQRTF